MKKIDTFETTAVAISNNSLPVSQSDLDVLQEKRKILKTFVKKQLVINVDFGVIPGVDRASLFKPGAEKLTHLFGLRTEINLVDKLIDHNGNFAFFIYKCAVYHIGTGIKITECEAMCNSKEKKYATRKKAIYENDKYVRSDIEETPIYDIMNTLMKMAQKRCFVGAIVMATGASDFFTHDIEDEEDAKAIGASKTKPAAKVSPDNLGEKPSNSQVSFSASGETSKHKDALKGMGGKWNPEARTWDFKNVNAEVLNKVNSLAGLKVVA